MTFTLEEVTRHRTRLRQEIMERECLLAAFDVVEKYAANGHPPNPQQLGGLLSALLPSHSPMALKELADSAPPEPAAAPPPTPPPERYMHPELKAICQVQHGKNGQLVAWAVRQMTGDYSLRDIAELLKREGAPMRSPEISVVLTRFKNRGEIEEIKRSAGPHPAVFRKSEAATSFQQSEAALAG